MQTLKNRTCVIAGATAGDGREVARELCLGGMNVVLMTHNRQAAESLISEISAMKATGKCIYYEGDEGEGPAEENPKFYEKIADELGSVDVVIANTGGSGKLLEVEDVSRDDLEGELNHLVCGSFFMVQAALPYLKRSKAARVILMSSVEGINGGTKEGFCNAVAKGAVASLAKNLSSRLRSQGITINAIAKGAVKRVDPIPEGNLVAENLIADIPADRVGTSSDLAGLVAFLASEESSYMTGQVISLSGGWNGGI